MAFLLHQLLSESADRHPDRVAVEDDRGRLTYAELESLSSQIAHYLRNRGIEPGDRVGLFLRKSIYGVAALFGIQKAGAAYVPLDPQAPPLRAAYILQNCGVRVLVTEQEKLQRLPAEFLTQGALTGLLLVDSEAAANLEMAGTLPAATLAEIRSSQPIRHPAVPITDDYLAYILYTSGSTGEPKGVMISHLNSLTFVNWAYDTFHVVSSDRVSNHAPFHFDLSVFDIFCTIKAGGTLSLVPDLIHPFPVELARWISEKRLTIWYSVPSALIQLVERGHLERHDYRALRLVLFAGEVFPIKYVRRLVETLPHPEYYNLYGPTETNVCTYYKLKPEDLNSARTEPVPIGVACENQEVVVLNERLEPVPKGNEGELYVRSATVAKGYWGRLDDTAKVVVPNPLNRHFSSVLYRTGDIVRQLPSGEYQYVGRKDKMVKSRGYRIELGEIEATLYAHPAVREAAVIAVPDDQVGARLKAYVVADSNLARSELEKFCRDHLPRYMMPESMEFRSSLPRTSNGKVDIHALEKGSVAT